MKYNITYYLNTACAERRPETWEDVHNGWKVEEKEFETDLEAYEYAMKDCLEIDYLDEIYEDEDAQSDIEKIEAIQDYFDNQDPSDGSILLISIEGPEQAYDFGFDKPEIDDLEEAKEPVSEYKQKFIDFCSDKIEDLGDIMIDDIPYHIIMHTEGIREFTDLRIIADLDNYEFENLVAINDDDKIVINSPMIDFNEYAATMQFDVIDEKFYDNLMNYWDDLNMDERVSDELGE